MLCRQDESGLLEAVGGGMGGRVLRGRVESGDGWHQAFRRLYFCLDADNSELQDLKTISRISLPHLTTLELHVNQLQDLLLIYKFSSEALRAIRLEMNQLQSLEGMQLCLAPALKLLSFSIVLLIQKGIG